MTSRIGKPDTDADIQLRICLDQNPPINFVMVAGAGSGKTTSLIKALDHLAHTRGTDLRRRGQQIACITYTEIAVGEIRSDVGNASLFHISTIHSFLWTIIRPFQNDIREWIISRIAEKIVEAEEKISRPRTQARTRIKLSRDIERYQNTRNNVATINRFTYGTGSDYSNGILGHDDILKIGPKLILENPLLCKIIAGRFPFIFVDESQDTFPDFVDALRQIVCIAGENFCLGFFGDSMQKIYLHGAGPIIAGNSWRTITKPENFRCPAKVLRVINCIRAEDDGLEQIERSIDGIQLTQGSARMFILQTNSMRNEHLLNIRHWLSDINNDPLWRSDNREADVRVLILVHRMAARRLGFAELYAALNDNGATNLKDGLLDGSAWVLRPFMSYILPLIHAVNIGADFDIIALMRNYCPLISQVHISDQNVPNLLRQLKDDVANLAEMFENGRIYTIRDVLSFIHRRELAVIDDRFNRYFENREVDESDAELVSESAAVNAFLDCRAIQLLGYRNYIEDESPFATQQGVKGAEFNRVLVVLDDEESDYNLFSYGKYFGFTPLSDTDRQNIVQGDDSVISRTRRLFYVCCSRAVKDLAVVLFVQNVNQARQAIIEKGIFTEDEIYVLSENNFVTSGH